MRFASMVYSERSFQKINTKRAWSAISNIGKSRSSKASNTTKRTTKDKPLPHPEECDLTYANCATGPADYQTNLTLTGKDNMESRFANKPYYTMRK